MIQRMLAYAALALAVAAPSAHSAGPTLRNMELLAHFDEYSQGPIEDNYSACWSYIHSDGREYAILGVHHGTAIYNVTNPAAVVRVGFIPGPSSIWREMKSYRNWIYVVTEGTGAGQGLQIIRMTNPDAPVLAATWTGSFVRSHTVAVDTARALLICNGTRAASGQASGLRILSLANPEAPVEIGHWPAGGIPVPTDEYVHDSVPVGDRLYASSIYSGFQRILDIGDPTQPTQLTAWTYTGAFTHNAWPDATGKYLYATDEINGRPLCVFDIEDIGFPTLVNGLTSNPAAIVHNAHVNGNELYLSNYTEGVRVLDLSDPAHPAEFAWADSYPGPSGGYGGVWEVCPYFPSGIVIASDMQTGLYVYQPKREYGLVRVEVELPAATAARRAGPLHLGGSCGASCTCDPADCAAGACDASCGCSMESAAAAAGFKVTVDASGDSLATPDDGAAVFAVDAGPHSVTVRRFGWYDEVRGFSAAVGSRDTIVVPMRQRPVGNFAGVVTDATTSEPIADAEVIVDATALHVHTDALGFYELLQVPDDLYRVHYRAPGYAPLSYVRRIGPGFEGLSVELAPVTTWEPMESDPGFIVGAAGDDATSGHWVRVEPLGTGLAAAGVMTGARTALMRALGGPGGRTASPFHEGHESDGVLPGDVQPETDRTPGGGTQCWVTGQGANPGVIDEADVDGGRTSLTSRAFDLSGFSDPVIGFWRWFYTSVLGDPNDALLVQLSNDGGATWQTARTIAGVQGHWAEEALRVRDHVLPGPDVRVRFVAQDLGLASVVEAAVDDLSLYEAGAAVGVDPATPRLALRAPWPNPSSDAVRVGFDLAMATPVELAIADVQGRHVRLLRRGTAVAGRHEAAWDGRDDAGRPVAAGLYFVRLAAAGGEVRARVVRVK